MKSLLKYTSKLKHLPRSGWLRHGINPPETVASHSWQMAIMAMQLSGIMIKQSYDFDKVIKMCLCHDLGESIIGDITPLDERYKAKESQEEEAVNAIALAGDMPQLILLFDEYQENKTPEAQLAHDLDKLDMYAQSLFYEKEYPSKDLSEFKISAIKEIRTPLGLAILQDLEKSADF